MVNTSENTPAGFEEGKIYAAEVVDQIVTTTTDDLPQVIVTVCITGRLRSERNPAAGTDPCTRSEVEVKVTFAPDRVEWATRDLESLGFDDTDISRLHPDHPEHASLLGREVHVRMKVVGDRQFWNLVRLRQPTPIAALRQAAQGLADSIAAVKERAKSGGSNKRQFRQAPTPDAGAGSQAPVSGRAAGGEGAA